MAHLQQFAYPGWGEWAKKNHHYSSAVRVGDRIVCAGQGGWDPHQKDYDVDKIITKDVKGEIAQAFVNVDIALQDAGSSWSQVFLVRTYSTSIPEQAETIVENLRKWMPNHTPVWTELGVSHLGSPQMNFEIDVEAHVEQK